MHPRYFLWGSVYRVLLHVLQSKLSANIRLKGYPDISRRGRPLATYFRLFWAVYNRGKIELQCSTVFSFK